MDDLVSSVFAAVRRRHRDVRQSGDRGATLIEMVVAMAIMTICGSIFVGAAVTLNRSTAKAQAVTTSATQTNQAFLVLDKVVRYAAVITTPGKSTGTGTTGDWYVELRDTTNGTEMCVQLRVDITSKQLQRRAWNAANPTGTVTAFTQIAPGITNGGVAAGSADQPFVLTALSTTAVHQRLTVNLVSSAGLASSSVTTRSSFTLAALNSAVPPPTSSVCQQMGRP